MTSITEKALREILSLERAAVMPNAKFSKLNTSPKNVDVEVDISDEKNLDEANIFTMYNQASAANSLRVDVQIDEDYVEEDSEEDDSSDSISESGEDTVYGQGTNPKPKDETYLSLLKKTTSVPKVKVKIK